MILKHEQQRMSHMSAVKSEQRDIKWQQGGFLQPFLHHKVGIKRYFSAFLQHKVVTKEKSRWELI